ncbi:nucleotide exchange factor GrpE [Amnibacterium kyonggiense]|uniref:Protein GrpE n=1 Tax=Amnibacterium kyonggiense TaxID=595671 RepID=A0A4R7FQD9_9MICO|nr:nucleotide exchange factor GrpE [Amnibacterium kyonggiense]TDS79888.1 molecular chaperone GrpE [Amnibacterium kyonggiense]
MTDDKQQPEGAPEEGAPQGDEEFIAAEGPDVETSLTDADQAFLNGEGDLPDGTPRQARDGAPKPGDEHLADLKRVTAEYANYRRRTERERDAIKDRATGDAARAILPVLDDLDRAEAHGDLAEGGPLTAIAQKLRGAVAKLGITPYGEKGEPFDPHQHDAIFQRESPDVQQPTVSDVVERGYRIGDTTLRVAKVVVDTPSGS